MILLTPGPASTTASVKAALVAEDTCHREQAFARLLGGIRRDLLSLAGGQESHEAVLFTGSGTCAVEAALSSMVPQEGRLLIINNGAYGERMAQMARVFGLAFCEWRLPWHEIPDPALLGERLQAGGCTHLAFVHHETSTGILNPLEELVAVASRLEVRVLVDAMSSFGGLPLDLGQVPVDYLVSSANKCLQGMPGISFVLARTSCLDQMASYPPRSFYTNLALEALSARAGGQMRFTPAVQVLHALRQALDELLEETLPRRVARYRENWEALWSGLCSLGFKKLLPDILESHLLTSYLAPKQPAYNFKRHHDLLLEEGFVIYPAKPAYSHTFRLGNIGAIGRREILEFLQANARVLTEMGVKLPLQP